MICYSGLDKTHQQWRMGRVGRMGRINFLSSSWLLGFFLCIAHLLKSIAVRTTVFRA
jgi:hypothetical protein